MDSKTNLIEKARLAREERALAKRQDKAIIVIQSTIRKFLVRCRLTNHSVALLRETLNNENCENRDAFHAIKNFLIVNRLKYRKVNFRIFSTYLSSICKYISTSILSGGALKTCYPCLVLQTDLVKAWTEQVQALISLSLKNCALLDVSTASHKDLFLVYLRFALLITEVSSWKPLSTIRQFEVLRPGFVAVTHLFLSHAHSQQAVSVWGQNLLGYTCSAHSTQVSQSVLTSIFTLLSRVLTVSTYSNESLTQLCRDVLSIPAIVEAISESTVNTSLVVSNGLPVKLIHFLSLERNLKGSCDKMDFNRVLFLLGNLVHICFIDREESIGPKMRANFVDVVTQLLGLLKQKCQFTSSSATKLWHEIFGYIPQTDSRVLGDVRIVKGQVSLLWRPELVQTLFAPLTSLTVPSSATGAQQAQVDDSVAASTSIQLESSTAPSPPSQSTSRHSFQGPTATAGSVCNPGLPSLTPLPPAANAPPAKHKSKASRLFRKAFPSLSASRAGCKPTVALDSLEMFHIAAVCRLYQLAREVLVQCKVELVCGLTRLENILPHLLHFILMFASRDAARFFTDLIAKTAAPSDAPSPHHTHTQIVGSELSGRAFCVLGLFCECTLYLTTILDDIEVFEQERLFPSADLELLVLLLNRLCFELIWQHPHLQSHVPVLFNSLHSLLTLLVQRNHRRQFVALESLLVRELKVSALMTELERKTPRAEQLLLRCPHTIPHKDRVLLFRKMVNDERGLLGLVETSRTYPKSTLITVRRTRILEDGFHHLNSHSLSDANMKGIIRVKFVNEQGLLEAGIDQDGVFKEFLEESISRIFNPELGLFRVTGDNRLYPSPTSHMHENHLALFEYVGRLLGKAVFEGIVVEVHFATFFLTQLLGSRGALYSCIDELPSLDEQLFRSLNFLKHYEGDVSDLDLTFSVAEQELGEVRTHELCDGGALQPVTNANRILYIHLMALFKMHTQIKAQSAAFKRGFRSVIGANWVAMFSGPELQRLLSGDTCDVDTGDMRAHTVYYGGYHNSHKVIKWFWEVVEQDFSREERGLLLKFATSCSKPPLLGFSYLEPPFSIRRVEQPEDTDEGDTVGSIVRGFLSLSANSRRSGSGRNQGGSGGHSSGGSDSVARLPTSSTCFNLLKLPHYQKRATLRDKLRYAIHSNVGFELS